MSFSSPVVERFWNTDSSNVNIFGNHAGSDFLTNSDQPPGCDWNPLPGDLTLEKLAVIATAVSGDTYTFQPFKGIPKANTGSAVVLTPGQLDVEGAVAVTVSAPAIAADLATQAFGWRGSSLNPVNIDAKTMFKYSNASPYDKYSIVGSGFGFSNFFSAVATQFLGLNATSSATESTVQFAMPIAGTFKYLLAVLLGQDTSADSTYTASLRVNGASVISTTFTNAASPTMGRETTTGAHVAAGDLVCFRFNTSGPTNNGHRTKVYAAVGFLPD